MLRIFALTLACMLGLVGPAFAGAIQVTDAEATVDAERSTLEVFMNIKNTGDTHDRLYAARSKAAINTSFRST